MNNTDRCPFCYGVLDGKYCPNGCGLSPVGDDQPVTPDYDEQRRLQPFADFLDGLEDK